MKIKILLLLILLTGCSTARLVNAYKNSEDTPLTPEKILVVGITHNMEAREAFEYGLQKAFRKKSIEALPSLDYFSQDPLLRKMTLAEVSQLEQQLIADNFNTVIIARVISVEDRENLILYMANLDSYYKSFQNDYYDNQTLDQRSEQPVGTKIFHTETGIYNISKTDRRDLIWRGRIDIVNPEKTRPTVNQYIKRLIATLKEEEIIIFRN